MTSIEVATQQMIAASMAAPNPITPPSEVYQFDINDFTKDKTFDWWDHYADANNWTSISVHGRDIYLYEGKYYMRKDNEDFWDYVGFSMSHKYIGCYTFNNETNSMFTQGAKYHLYVNQAGDYFYLPCN